MHADNYKQGKWGNNKRAVRDSEMHLDSAATPHPLPPRRVVVYNTFLNSYFLVLWLLCWFAESIQGWAQRKKIITLLFSLALSLSVSQLKPEILVCRMAAAMINVVEERQRQTRALQLVCVDGSYFYTVHSASWQKCEGEKGVGDYNVVGPPL